MLTDAFGRSFHYLRLSVTDVCNYACVYCLPHGYQKPAAREADLSLEEIERLVRAFAAIGFWKVRITGGEPTARRDLIDIVRAARGVSGVRRVALSTNGHGLRERLDDLIDAGLSQLNVSLDALDAVVFARITGRDEMAEVKAGIEAAAARGIAVKVNAVLMPETVAGFDAFAEWVRALPVTVRFIELMQTQDNGVVFLRQRTSAAALRDRLRGEGWALRARAPGDGPAEEYRRDGFAGGLGIIAAYAPGFCDTCNRLRVSRTAKLRLCLFGDDALDLRPWLQRDDQQPALLEAVRAQLRLKTAAHRLHEGNPGATEHLAAIGG